MRSTCSIATLLTCGSLLARAQGAAPAMVTAQATLPPAGEVLRVRATCGAVGGQVVVSVGSPEAVRLTLAGVDCPAQNKDYSMTKIPKEVHLRDGAITAAFKNGPRFTYYLRPNPRFYVGKEFEAALQQWDQRPAASEHVFTLLARRQAEGVEWWLDGRYLTMTPLAADQSAIAITVSGGGALAETGAAPDPLAGSARSGSKAPIPPPGSMSASPAGSNSRPIPAASMTATTCAAPSTACPRAWCCACRNGTTPAPGCSAPSPPGRAPG